jgi:hypothetical protein
VQISYFMVVLGVVAYIVVQIIAYLVVKPSSTRARIIHGNGWKRKV